jgi:hypothetical protein
MPFFVNLQGIISKIGKMDFLRFKSFPHPFWSYVLKKCGKPMWKTRKSRVCPYLAKKVFHFFNILKCGKPAYLCSEPRGSKRKKVNRRLIPEADFAK